MNTDASTAPSSAHAPKWKLGQTSAAAILSKELPPIKYIVPGYLCEGLTILAGKPKIGKSWFALDLAIAVAMGGYALGGNDRVTAGDVLYLALEDNERRLQKRLKLLLHSSSSIPERLFIDVDCPRLDQGGLQAIECWIMSANAPRLLIIDVAKKVRAPQKAGDNIYEADYAAFTPSKALADKYGIAILVLHHTRKQEADDPFDTVSGSTGLTGVADTVLVLTKDAKGPTLYGRGRDIEEFETAMRFDKHTGTWTALGNPEEVRMGDERASILKLLLEAIEPMGPNEIAAALKAEPGSIRQLLFQMLKQGQVEKVARGKYMHPDKAQPSSPTPS